MQGSQQTNNAQPMNLGTPFEVARIKVRLFGPVAWVAGQRDSEGCLVNCYACFAKGKREEHKAERQVTRYAREANAVLRAVTIIPTV